MKQFLARIREFLSSWYDAVLTEDEIQRAISEWQVVSDAAIQEESGDGFAWNYVKRTHRRMK